MIRRKKVKTWPLPLLIVGLCFMSCRQVQQNTDCTTHALDIASYQLKQSARMLNDSMLLPRSTWTYHDEAFLVHQLGHDVVVSDDPLEVHSKKALSGQQRNCPISDWTSGFFPGSLWYAYELTGDEELKQQAVRYTNILYPIHTMPGTHDLGFMINCSYGNALRLAHNDTIATVIVETADALCNRFNPAIGCIRSWDFGTWNFPVIIDNMMNLDLLFSASKITGNNKYYNIAVTHAQTTMKHHFRPDYTSYHLVSYNEDGTVEKKETHQGRNDESAWSRGQAWAVYGYTSCYRETKDTVFLNQAIHIADMIMERVKTNDSIPYWDYDAPVEIDTPRDASAASITASALIELSTLVSGGEKYLNYAEAILKNLSSPEYLAKKGENYGFILKHSTGSLPHNSEVDTPINYADYYYLEGLQRLKMQD
ncbi:DUF4995 domain-containing protein [Bacteroides sp. 519]|uniref:DUF4995 domain-containing protein n=1 Tax=Bacteroides sp. 519 TaxID=2302937 RepID=UPI002106453E|nr:DUF4995 domain-containing protein [Bacteroides sp. 519]NDV59457.1 glucuronyl hydrolase [Bacteroides sp. 519]